MKKLIILGSMCLLATAGRATIVNSGTLTANLDITDGNAVGVFTSAYTLSNAGQLNSVQVTYNLSGGRAGDLVGYLLMVDGTTTHSINLFNRLGVSGGDVFGSGNDASTLNQAALDVTSGFGGGTLNVGANTTWTLYLADLATGGGTSQLTSWGVSFDVSVVPEPVTWALIIFGTLAGGTLLLRRRAGLKEIPGKITAWIDAV